MKLKLLLPLLTLCAVVLMLPQHASAASSFNPNHIIDDYVFDNSHSMTASAIDAFLNSFPSSCISTNSGFLAIDPTGYNPTQGFSYGGFVSAGQVIFDASQAYGINPQVLITTLEKEQSLVTGQNNFSGFCNNGDQNKYAAAVGYGCPDSVTTYSYTGLSLYQRNGVTVSSTGTTCVNSASKAGFSQQVVRAAWLLKFGEQRSEGNINWAVIKGNWDNSDDPQSCYGGPMTQGTWQRCPSGGSAYYDGYTTIDGTAVHMDTGSTAALYWYTPHFHGNQNFFDLFMTWFGPSIALQNVLPVSSIQLSDASPASGETISYHFELTNTLDVPLTLDGVGGVGRFGSLTGNNRDLGWQGPVTLQAGETRGFTFYSIMLNTGNLYVWPAVLYQGSYAQYNNWGSTLPVRTPNLSLTQDVGMNVSPPIYAREDATFSAVLRNNEPNTISYDAIGIPLKLNGSTNYDVVWVGPGSLTPGQTLSLSGLKNLDTAGKYTYWVSDYFGGTYTTIGSMKNITATEASPNFSVSALSFTTTTPVTGDPIGASFTVTNNLPVSMDVDAVGVVGRYGTFNGPNRDLGWQGPVHFNAGETKTFTGYSRKISDVGTHYYWIGVLYKGSYMQYNNWGSTIVSRAPNFSVSGLTFTDNSPAVGESLSASFTITNNLTVPVDVDAVGVVGRYGTFNGPNRDLGWQGPVHFNAGETKSFTETGTVTEAGTHYYWIGVFNNNSFLQYNNWGSTIISHS